VATRRLRSAVRTFDRLFEEGPAQLVTRDLAWLASELGAARDAEVLRARLAGQVSVEREQHRTTAAVARAVDREMGRAQRETFAHVMAALDSDRYRLLVASLDELVRTPPFTPRAARPARAELLRPVRKAARKVDAALKAADEHPHGAERAATLHQARKKAKRARYAAEALAPAIGRQAEAFASAMESLQDLLGEHHDSVVLQHRLEDLAQEAEPARAFTLGRLHAAQSTVQAELETSIRSAAKAAERKSLRAWLA
jgi:CHAD domain-containing protein